MQDDFFADLMPIKPRPGPQVPENGTQQGREQGGPTSHDAVLVSGLESGRSSVQADIPDLLGSDVSAGGRGSQREPLMAPKQSTSQSNIKEFEGAVEATMRRFATGLQRVLEDINRRLESLETQTERLSQAVSDAGEAEGLREGAVKASFAAVTQDLRDIQRSVQLVRDKQELLEAQAELAKLAAAKKSEDATTASPPAPVPTVKATAPPAAPAEALAPAPSVASQPSLEPPKPAAPVAPPLLQPSVPQMPASHQQPPPAAQAPQAPEMQPRPPQYGTAAVNPAPQYSAPHPVQQEGSHHFSAAPQAPTQPVAQGYPHRPPPLPSPPASQYSAPPPPPPSQQYSAPPTPFSAPQSNFQPPAPQYSVAPSQQPYGNPSQSSVQSGYPSGYPNLSQSQPSLPNAPPPPHRYPLGGAPPPPPSSGSLYGRHDYAPPPPRSGPESYRESGGYSSGQPSVRPPPPSGQTASRNMPLEQVIDDVANMGFSRHDVRAVVSELMERGQAVDLNIVLDRLMNGPRR